MKPKIQVAIGLLTAAVCVIAILTLYILSLFLLACTFPFALVFPIAYGVALIRQRLNTAKTVFFIWCGGWLLSCVLFALMEVLGVAGMCAMCILESTVTLPIWAPVALFFEYSLAVRAISGAVFMVLFWTGIRGLKQIIEAEQKAYEEKNQRSIYKMMR